MQKGVSRVLIVLAAMAVLGVWGGSAAFAAAPDLGLQQTFTEPGITALGSSVALATDKAVVGSAGKAIVYTKVHNTWARVAELVPEPAESTALADAYGYSSDMTDNIAVVGAPYYSADRGAVYVFIFSSTLNAWVYKQRLTPSAPVAGEKFGVSVSVSGSTIVVGASGEIPPGGTETLAGAAYVFTRASDSDPWTQAARVTGPASAAGDWFGHVVSLHYDTLVVGAPKVASLSGRAYVYTVAPAGTLTLQKTLEAVPDSHSGGHFGCSVIVRGSTIIVGAPGMNNGAFSFVKSGGDWVAEDQLVCPGWSPSDYYGWGVALCNDTALVAGFQDEPSKTGYAAFFTRSNGEWTYRGDVQLGSSKAPGDRYGYAIDLYCTIAAVGAPGDNAGAGTVYFHSTCMPVPIYRFYNPRTGTHFYTDRVEERDRVWRELSRYFAYEGPAYTANPANNDYPLHRFYNVQNGSHFYTPNLDEVDSVKRTMSGIFHYDGPTYSVSMTDGGEGKTPVHRFFNLRNGSHFYSANADEVAHVRDTMQSSYKHEGVAFYLGQ